MTETTRRVTQCQKPSGWIGRFIVKNMNSRHSKLTDWGLSHAEVMRHYEVLDVGCGGGRTIRKLAELASAGKVFGIDYSDVSVSVARKLNAHSIEQGRVEIQEASVSQLPFDGNAFDVVTAVETHFWWPDLPAGLHEIFRVLKPSGTLVVIAEIYKGAGTRVARIVEKDIPRFGMNLLTPDEHRAAFVETGFSNVQIVTESTRGWICAVGRKPQNVEGCKLRADG
jgi:ubiquinone/menaquinone biosynthesis C-methylase UbiE